jgi:hypothetical protein
VTVLVIVTGICAAGVLFMLRFLIALCQDSEPENAVHLLRATPARTTGVEPDAGNEDEPLILGDSHPVRTRRVSDAPAAATARWSAIGVASSARRRAMKQHSAT